MNKIMDYFQILLISLISLNFVACGDLFMKDQKASDMTFNQFAQCELDMDAFSNIMEKNIKGDIECLREKIKMFIEAVETDRPGFASKTVLKDFLLTGPIDVEADVIEIIDSIFDLSHIIVGSEKNYIKHSDIDLLLDFLIYFNKHSRETYKYFNSEDKLNYDRLIKERDIVYREFSLIANKLKQIYESNRSGVDSIDSENFVFNFFKNSPDTLESVKALMFLKRVFLGGEKWKLTHLEFATALDILPDLAQIAFDVSKGKYYEFDEPERSALVFRNDVRILEGVTYFNPESDEAVFTLYDVVNAIDTLDPELLGDFDLTKYPKELKKLKEVFLGGINDELFFAKELYRLYEHGEDILSRGILGFRIYDYYKDELNSPAPISHDFSGYTVNNARDEKFRDHFAYVANYYQYFKGENEMPFYSFGSYRNPSSFFEIMTIEYVVSHIMQYYGNPNDGARGVFKYHMILETECQKIDNRDKPHCIEERQACRQDPSKCRKLDQSVLGLVKDFKWVLKDQGLVNIGRKGGGELNAVADNVVLLSTLFQKQSDGCDFEGICMEVPEVTEFIVGLFTAIELKEGFTEKMVAECATELDENGRIEPDCFRRNFIKVLRKPNKISGYSIADYMPQLDKYLDSLTADVVAEGKPITESPDYMKFMTETEAFTRVCTHYDEGREGEEVWLKEDDAFAVFAGLLNVESTMLRYDLDQNGKMDYKNAYGKNEVLNAYYETYEDAIKGLLPVEGILNKLLARPVFQFLIKFGRTPDTKKVSDLWKLGRVIVSKKYRRADAERATISTILKVVGEENAKSRPVPNPFQCTKCIDPGSNCQPEDDMWDL